MSKLSIRRKKIICFIMSALVVGIVLLVLSADFDFWYDLNDDVMIKDITSGIYTGEPETNNIQMQYPISLILARLYKITDEIEWYPLFLVSCQALCLILVFYRGFETVLPNDVILSGTAGKEKLHTGRKTVSVKKYCRLLFLL